MKPSVQSLNIARRDISSLHSALKAGWVNQEASALIAKANETGMLSLTSLDCRRLEHLSDLALTDKLSQRQKIGIATNALREIVGTAPQYCMNGDAKVSDPVAVKSGWNVHLIACKALAQIEKP